MKSCTVILPFIVIVSSLFSCGNPPTPYHDDDSTAKDINDSLNHEEIQARLRETEGDTVIGGIYFGMSRQEYIRELDKIKAECGDYSYDLKIRNAEFRFGDPAFYNHKLYEVKLDGHCGMILLESFFKEKYGKPTHRYDRPRTSVWEFDYKVVVAKVGLRDYATIQIYKPSIVEEIEAQRKREEKERAAIRKQRTSKNESFAKQL